ncbi:MAG: glycosyltransferase family 2 protein [Candidatus Levyibacteriota bacterium]
MSVFIIVLHFGDPGVTKDCIKSILDAGVNFTEIIVVDNNQNFVYKKKEITTLKNKKNLGFAGGVNVGIKYAMTKKADYILLLNNDTSIKRNFLKTLVEFAEQTENAGIIGPAIKFKKDSKVTYDIGGKINNVFGRTSHFEVNKIVKKSARIVDYISGCCMLIKTDVLKKIGFFDERFFLYYEDVDFCLRARRKNFLTYVLPEVSVEHALSKTVGKISPLAVYHQTQSAIRFGKKYYKKNTVLNLAFILIQSLNIFRKNPKVGSFAFLAIYKNL